VPPGEAVDSFCRRKGIRFIQVGPLDDPATIAAVEAEKPDLAIYAGAGILRKGILGVPRLGTLNAHMGILPEFRGMNVAEWSRWYGAPTGCTVHLVDTGIDTGDIVCCRAISTAGAKSIFELRQIIDAAQIALLGEVVEYVVATGSLPARRSQTAAEGRQYFAMHPEVRQLLEKSLAGS
jgi:methionyl-tRNA formyltransferase